MQMMVLNDGDPSDSPPPRLNAYDVTLDAPAGTSLGLVLKNREQGVAVSIVSGVAARAGVAVDDVVSSVVRRVFLLPVPTWSLST
jgi:hypothetical protein